MSVKERILAALAKGDAQDREFRESVYRLVFAALEKSVKTNPEMSADDVYRRREHIVAVIEEVEKDFAAAEAQLVPELDIRPEPERIIAGPEADFVPSISHEERLAPQGGKRERARARKVEALLREDGREPKQKRKRWVPWWLRLTLWLLVLAFLVWGGLWLWKQGDEAVRTGGASIEEIIGNTGPLVGGRGPLLPSRDDGQWVEVFNPSDTSTMQTANGAQTSTDEQGEFVSIGGSKAVVFQVDPGTLQQFAGRTVTFSVRARAPEGETQIAVNCDFGAMGKCNRLRYVVGPTTADYLFDVKLANASAAGGTISIVPDVEGKGRNLDVFHVAVTTE